MWRREQRGVVIDMMQAAIESRTERYLRDRIQVQQACLGI
jgi:hypothetical protein